MNKKIRCIMLIDDNLDDNFFHERVIRKSNLCDAVVTMQSGQEALHYLTARQDHIHLHPEIIFLDINMPGMNGWEFLHEYNQLDKEVQCKEVVVMLTSSENPDDKAKALALNVVCDFKTKPLTREMLEEIIDRNF